MIKWTKAVGLSITGLILFGCVPPYRAMVLDGIDDAAARRAQDVRNQFATRLPNDLRLVQSVILNKSFFSVSAVGYADIDRQAESFAVVGVNPLGVKLFEVKGDRHSLSHSFALDIFTKRGDFVDALAADIRAIYFDMLPSDQAQYRFRRHDIVFRDKKHRFRCDYVFDRKTGLLREKRGFRGAKRIWRVFYNDYAPIGGQLIPGTIKLKHDQHRYQLKLILKEVK